MQLTEIKSNLNKPVFYNGAEYIFLAYILRKGKDGYIYSAELKSVKCDKSLTYARLQDVEVIQ